jgi:hypothetical protein
MTPLNILKRGRQWKDYVQASILELRQSIAELSEGQSDLNQVINEFGQRVDDINLVLGELKKITLGLQDQMDGHAADADKRRSVEQIVERTARIQGIVDEALCANFERKILNKYIRTPAHYSVFVTQRGDELLFLVAAKAVCAVNGIDHIDALEIACRAGAVAVLISAGVDGPATIVRSHDFVSDLAAHPAEAKAWLEHRRYRLPTESAPDATLDRVVAATELIDFAISDDDRKVIGPYLPPFASAEPRRRSVLFTRHCYYNFFYLAKALRARGWDAVSLSTEAVDGLNNWLYHGQDLTIYDPDPARHRALIGEFYKNNADRFGIFHHYGLGAFTLFTEFHDRDSAFGQIPWDMVEAKRRGALLGYSHSGCLDGVSQSSFRNWSPDLCENCNWAAVPDVCSDERNLRWGSKLTTLVDLFCTETDPGIDFKGHPNAFRGPLTFANDPDVWKPDLEIPERFRHEKKPGVVAVYHGVGNYKTRTKNGKNVKGTQAVINAIERLQAEGIDIELYFVDNIPSRDNRFVQVQADIIVDQLNYGRYGALAREGMMLGKPVVGRVNKIEHDGSPATACIQETPIVHADENTVLDVLRDLAINSAKRAEIGRASREHAIKWWSADRLAERFERVYDHIRAHGRPPAEEDVP